MAKIDLIAIKAKGKYDDVTLFPILKTALVRTKKDELYGVYDSDAEIEVFPCKATEITVVGNSKIKLSIPTKLLGIIPWIPQTKYIFVK